MEKQLLMESLNGQIRLALLEDGKLCELYTERKGQEKLSGNIYMGRAMNVLPGMQAAFIDIGLEKNGFLHAGDISIDTKSLGKDAEALAEHLKNQSIRRLVKPGQEVLTQVIKEPGGSKGPRLSCNITLPGRLVVLLPTVSYVGISRRIESEAERARLHELADRVRPEGIGLIIRTAAEGVDEAALREDFSYLMRLWESIQKTAVYSSAPTLLHADMGLVNRSVRDMLHADVSRLVIDGQQAYEVAKKHAQMLSDEIACKVELSNNHALFDAYHVDVQLDRALKRKVWLKSGGYLVFDHAEALTVIDVNTGKFVGKHSLSDTVFKINCEAVYEITRQIRLRDIGGIIVIDFIDMDDPDHREALMQLLRQELKHDHTKTNLVGLTGLGLVEMTRKKIHRSLHKQLLRPCDVCQGSGMVLTDESVARLVLNRLRSLASEDLQCAWLISASAGVAGQLLLVGGLDGVKAYVVADAAYTGDHFDIDPILEHQLPPKSRKLTV